MCCCDFKTWEVIGCYTFPDWSSAVGVGKEGLEPSRLAVMTKIINPMPIMVFIIKSVPIVPNNDYLG